MKKLLSTLLALTMLIVCAVPALAADDSSGDVRDTEFFTDQPHTDLNYSDIQYEYIDPAPFLDEVAALKELAKDPANAAEFETRFLTLKDTLYKMYAMYVLLDNMTYHDALDEWAADELAKVDDNTNVVGDAFNGLVRDVLLLENACSEVLSSKLTEEDIQDYLDYEDMTDEERELANRETTLESKYRATVVENYTTVIDGEEYDADGLYYAFYRDHTISLEDYLKGNHEVYKPLADIYLEMIDVRNQIAKLNGYDNYADYAYAETYRRDYTVEEITAFREAVKKYVAPALMEHTSWLPDVDADALPLDASAYTGEKVFDTLAPYFGKLSDELLESMTYVKEHGSYDLEPAPNKTGTAFSRNVYYYNMPYYFSNASGTYQDLLTTIHEMGHNNNTYWSGQDWTDTSSNIDTAEVHSQGLELLMTRYYPELFGTQADAVAQNNAIDILYSVVQGCIHDELQCYAYTTPNVTAEMLNQKYRQIAEDYSLVDSSDVRPEMYGWYGIPHTFTSPMYYISYAVSAAGAFAFWEEAQDDYFKAVDHYLEFVAMPGTVGFQDCFLETGMESPLSPSYIEALGKTTHDKLMFYYPYTDVYTDSWYIMGVYAIDMLGLMDGTSDTTFSPAVNATRAEILTALARLFDEREDAEEPYTLEQGAAWAVENGVSDGKDLAAPMTRVELAATLRALVESLGVDVTASGDLSDYTDVAGLSADEADAMSWVVDNGILGGSEDLDGNWVLNPQGNVTRAQIATVMYRYYLYLVS
jgi:M3 family oligoendopeptidase